MPFDLQAILRAAGAGLGALGEQLQRAGGGAAPDADEGWGTGAVGGAFERAVAESGLSAPDFLPSMQSMAESNQLQADMPGGYEALAKAINSQMGAAAGLKPEQRPHGIFVNPYSVMQMLGFRDRPSTVTFATMETMYWKLPIIQGVRQTRLTQIVNHAVFQRPPYEPGARIALRNKAGNPTAAERMEALRLEALFDTCGVYRNDRRENVGFPDFFWALARDSLTYDAGGIQTVMNRKGKPCQWVAMDARTLRLADLGTTSAVVDMDDPFVVQVLDGVPVDEWTRREMAYVVRNPTTDINRRGYGTSEVEMIVGAITYLLWGMQYNGNYFKQGGIPKGILQFAGSIPQKHLRQFRSQWYQLISGAENAWRVPLINADQVNWIPMIPNNRDMEFAAWIDFLIKVVTAVFLIDPIEIGFKYGNSGSQKSAFEAANKVKIVESKNKGLWPILRRFERTFNENLIWPINEDFAFEFTGMLPMTPAELAALETQQARSYLTVNEIRARHDMEPREDGDIILDPVFQQAQMMRMQVGPFLPPQPDRGVGDTGAKPGATPGQARAGTEKSLARERELEGRLTDFEKRAGDAWDRVQAGTGTVDDLVILDTYL